MTHTEEVRSASMQPPADPSGTGLTGTVVAALLFITSLIVFYRSPIVQVGDSHYSMLLSENLIKHRTFVLDRYFQPPNPPVKEPNRLGQDWAVYPNDYAVGLSNGHYFYTYPPGSSILSAPFVGMLNMFGISAANPDNTYNFRGEVLIERMLAALLMAFFSVMAYATARLMLPISWSALIGFSVAFGSPVWSTASRAMWGHTWNIVLIGLIAYVLLAHETGRRKLNPWLLASLVGLTYFVRPSNSTMIVLVSLYVLLRMPWRTVAIYTVTGAAWLALFLAYSQHYFKTWLPIYYHLFNQMGISHGYFNALGGLTISPSRGVLTHIPILLVVIWLLISRWRGVEMRWLAALSATIVSSALITGAFFAFWHGGGSFGPRYSTDSLPWWILLSIISLAAWRKTRAAEAGSEWRLGPGLIASLLLVALGVFIHARGATASDTWYTWGSRPVPMEHDVARCWDWRRPQFLEGLTAHSREAAQAPAAVALQGAAERPREEYPQLAVGSRLDLLSPDSDKYLDGFSAAGGEQRNTEGKTAVVRFRLDRYIPGRLRFSMQPFLFQGKHDTQVVEVSLNGQPLASFVLREPGFREYTVTLPRNSWSAGNRIVFHIPAADSHKNMGISPDTRMLGVGMQWLEIVAEDAEIGARAVAPATHRIDLRSPELDGLLLNFSGPNTPQRNTLARRAEIRLPHGTAPGGELRLSLQPFIFGEQLSAQTATLTWNGLPLGSLTLREPGMRIYTIPLPRNYWRDDNMIGIELPQATSQKALGISPDERILGVGIEWIEIAR